MGFGQAYAAVLSDDESGLLLDAAEELIDTTLMDLNTSNRSDWTADNWLIGTLLPPRYRLKYTAGFARKFFVCLITVVWKLGQREPLRLSCVAEELAAHVLLLEAEAFAELVDDLSTSIVERAKDDELAILSSGGNPHGLSLTPPDLCQVRVGVDFAFVHIDQMGSKSSGSSGRK
jgi:hypothetical protein